PGEVADSDPAGSARTVQYDGNTYKLFQDAPARVTHVIGEFYWKVTVGESVKTVDWIRPPFGISKEIATTGAQEIAYSHARYMTAREVQEAFNVEGLNRPVGVGSMQPFTGAKLGKLWAVMLLLLFAVAIMLGVTLPGRRVMAKGFDLMAEPPVPGGPDNARISFSEPFEVSGKYNLVISVKAAVNNTWVYAAGDLVDEATGGVYSFEAPIEYYSGYSDGESWSEGSQKKTQYISRPDKGRYTLRLESQWEPGKPAPTVNIEIREGVFRWPYFIIALIVISVFPFFALIRQISFESERWKESAHNPYGTVTDDGEDDEEE
ncbi:MAG TPA: hypothetical protein VF491_12130, partial [Vicinamibacterales bacterium]